METYFLKNEDLPRFYARISQDYELYLPVKAESPVKIKCDYGFNLPTDDYAFKRHTPDGARDFIFNEYRCIEPIRAYLANFKEEIGDYFSGAGPAPEKPLAICGVKNCDLFSLRIL